MDISPIRAPRFLKSQLVWSLWLYVTVDPHPPQGLSLSGVEAQHIKDEIKDKIGSQYGHVTKAVVSANDSCGAVFTAFKSGT